MAKFDFNLNDFSKYRLQLMGISAMCIIICHMSSAKVLLPTTLKKVVELGNVGVDIFLFLSGMGLYYSLNRISQADKYPPLKSITRWYSCRFKRLLLPYLYLSLPYWLFICVYNNESLGSFFVHLSTIGFWLYHEGAWFVAFLIPLYLFTPILFKLTKLETGIAAIIWSILILLSMLLSAMPFSDKPIITNVQFCISRLPSFIIGIALAPLIKRGMSISVMKLILILAVLFILEITRRKLHLNFDIWFIPMAIFIIIFTAFLKISDILASKIKYNIGSIFTFLGTISLESYLTNIYLKDIFGNYVFTKSDWILNYGNYFMYSLVIIFGILISVVVHKLVSVKAA